MLLFPVIVSPQIMSKMKESRINFTVTLDKDNVPEKIMWDASDKESQGVEETKSISLTLWDEKQKNTLRIDLWTKDMPVDDMKRFYIDCLGGMAQNILNATGDEFIAQETNALAEKLVKHVKKTS